MTKLILTGKSQNHAVLESGRHASKATLCREDILVTENRLLSLAEGVGNRVTGVVLDGADADLLLAGI